MTRWRKALVAIGLCLAGLGVVPGCGQVHSDFGVKTREASWNDSLDGIFGIDRASVSVVTLKSGKHEEASFVVWSDVMGYSARGSSSRTSASYESVCLSGDGKGMHFRGAVSQGRPVTIQIAGTSYDLKQGTVFLVAARGTSPKVLQLDMDPGLFGSNREQLRELARSTDPIRTFFETETQRVPPSPKPRS